MEPSYAGLRLIEQGRSLLVVERLQEMQISCAIRILHGIKVSKLPTVAQLVFCETAYNSMMSCRARHQHASQQAWPVVCSSCTVWQCRACVFLA